MTSSHFYNDVLFIIFTEVISNFKKEITNIFKVFLRSVCEENKSTKISYYDEKEVKIMILAAINEMTAAGFTHSCRVIKESSAAWPKQEENLNFIIENKDFYDRHNHDKLILFISIPAVVLFEYNSKNIIFDINVGNIKVERLDRYEDESFFLQILYFNTFNIQFHREDYEGTEWIFLKHNYGDRRTIYYNYSDELSFRNNRVSICFKIIDGGKVEILYDGKKIYAYNIFDFIEFYESLFLDQIKLYYEILEAKYYRHCELLDNLKIIYKKLKPIFNELKNRPKMKYMKVKNINKKLKN